MRALFAAVMAGCAGDEPCEWASAYPDADGDGFGDEDGADLKCGLPEGFVRDHRDCDDGDAAVHPGAVEVCDSIDQDCDGILNDDPDPPRYEDADGDGYGNPLRPQACDGWAVPDGTDCDDADPEVHPGTTWYEDLDGDGFGAGSLGVGCQAPAVGAVPRGGDCDDGLAARHPGAHERCDGVDQDCVEGPDPADAWAFEGLRVRVPLTVTTPSRPTSRPIVVDLDLTAAVAEAGDPRLFDPGSLRAALHDCGGPLGTRELPVELLDGATGVLANGGGPDPQGDGVGSVVVLYDLDGDLATVEELPAGATVEVALYLQGESAPVVWGPADVVAADERLASAGLEATFDPERGGLLASLAVGGGPSVGDQTTATAGNGLRTLSGGRSAQDVPGTVVVLDATSLTAAVESSGHREAGNGGFDYTWTWRVFAGRPELWVEPWLSSTGPINVSGVLDATEPIRPLQLAFPEAAACTTDPGLGWADASDGAWGVTWAWAEAPLHVNYVDCTDSETWSSANDLVNGGPNPAAPTVGLPGGLDFVDSPVLVLLPHAGGADTVAARREALREGLGVTVGPVER